MGDFTTGYDRSIQAQNDELAIAAKQQAAAMNYLRMQAEQQQMQQQALTFGQGQQDRQQAQTGNVGSQQFLEGSAPGQQTPHLGATPAPLPVSGNDPSNPSPINPAPNPPPVQQAPIGQPMPPAPKQMSQVPMPGASPIPPAPKQMSQVPMPGASPIPPPGTPSPMSPNNAAPMSPQAISAALPGLAASMNGQGGGTQPAASQQPPAQAQGQQQLQMSDADKQAWIPTMQMYGEELKQTAQALKQAFPDSAGYTAQDRFNIQNALNKTIHAQTTDLYKQMAQALAMSRLGVNESKLEVAKDKAGLGDAAATNKVLDFDAKKAQATSAASMGGKMNQARADMSATGQKAMETAMGYLPDDANALGTYARNAMANFNKSPDYGDYIAKNEVVAGEIARVQAGGRAPTKGAIDLIASHLNEAGSKKNYQSIIEGYMSAGDAAARSSQDTTNRLGALPPDDASSSTDPMGLLNGQP